MRFFSVLRKKKSSTFFSFEVTQLVELVSRLLNVVFVAENLKSTWGKKNSSRTKKLQIAASLELAKSQQDRTELHLMTPKRFKIKGLT